MNNNNIPTYQACDNIVSWIQSKQALNLSSKTISRLFTQKNSAHPHPFKFILKKLYRNSLFERHDALYASKLISLFELINEKKLLKIDNQLVLDTIALSEKSNFSVCAHTISNIFASIHASDGETTNDVLDSSDTDTTTATIDSTDSKIMPNTMDQSSQTQSPSDIEIISDDPHDELSSQGIPIDGFINFFKTRSVSVEDYSRRIQTIPHEEFYQSVDITTTPVQIWPLLHILANLTTSEARAQKFNAICNHLGSNNVLEVLKQHNAYRNDTGYNLIHNDLKEIIMPEISGLSLNR
ncbi:MAG: hypothetical protein P8L77_04650 [Gammaproteobacteria bacterium]|nr:hypothetical protein [Gammaproteobacteria bacterium]